MLSVPLSTHDVTPLLGKQLSLAANNAPTLCVVSGPIDAVEALHNQLASKGIDSRYLFTSHAFHSETMEPILQPFIEQVRKIRLNPPTIPYISNVTGTWITAAETTDPTYWTRHLRQTVRFAEGIRELVHEPNAVLLEVGPGRTLCTLARQSLDKGGGQLVLASMRHAQEQQSDVAVLQSTLGKLWLAGVAVDWQSVHAHERRQHLPLPTYPFELKHYWIEPELQLLKGSPQPNRHTNQGDVDETQAPLVEEKAVSAQYERPNLQTPYVAPGSEIEERLAAIWQDILGIAPVGIYDNFFEMGGHSLMATQLLSQLRTAFPVEIPLRTIFEAPTIAQLSEAIEEILIAMLEEMPEDGTEPKG